MREAAADTEFTMVVVITPTATVVDILAGMAAPTGVATTSTPAQEIGMGGTGFDQPL